MAFIRTVAHQCALTCACATMRPSAHRAARAHRTGTGQPTKRGSGALGAGSRAALKEGGRARNMNRRNVRETPSALGAQAHLEARGVLIRIVVGEHGKGVDS